MALEITGPRLLKGRTDNARADVGLAGQAWPTHGAHLQCPNIVRGDSHALLTPDLSSRLTGALVVHQKALKGT